MIFCSFDIIKDMEKRPEAKQLKYSVLKYMNSKNFKPSVSMLEDEIKNFFK